MLFYAHSHVTAKGVSNTVFVCLCLNGPSCAIQNREKRSHVCVFGEACLCYHRYKRCFFFFVRAISRIQPFFNGRSNCQLFCKSQCVRARISKLDCRSEWFIIGKGRFVVHSVCTNLPNQVINDGGIGL